MSDILLTAIGAIALYLFAGLRVLREKSRPVLDGVAELLRDLT